MNNDQIKAAPLAICFLWNTYLLIYTGLDENDLLQNSLMYLALLIFMVIFPLKSVYEKWKSNPSGLLIAGIFLLLLTGFTGWTYVSSNDYSRIFLLFLNWVVLWVGTFILLIVAKKNESKQSLYIDDTKRD